jgi:hypothetical protein
LKVVELAVSSLRVVYGAANSQTPQENVLNNIPKHYSPEKPEKY